nr:WAS/WASL-interacting protein family member 1 [Ipomoea batatas]GMC62210.1 WAS/WASL-interacting protein family member 1 [Ipomoea batatas]
MEMTQESPVQIENAAPKQPALPPVQKENAAPKQPELPPVQKENAAQKEETLPPVTKPSLCSKTTFPDRLKVPKAFKYPERLYDDSLIDLRLLYDNRCRMD